MTQQNSTTAPATFDIGTSFFATANTALNRGFDFLIAKEAAKSGANILTKSSSTNLGIAAATVVAIILVAVIAFKK